MRNLLKFNKPASSWLESLPVGNGRISAMISGAEKTERLALNHELLWDGKYFDREVQESASHLPEVRQALLAGRNELATELAHKYFSGAPGLYRLDSFIPAGDLYIEFDTGDVSNNYVRSLDLDTAVAAVSYHAAGAGQVTREYFASFADRRIYGRLKAEMPLNVSFRLDRVIDPDCVPEGSASESGATLAGKVRRTSFVIECSVFANGKNIVKKVLPGGKLQVFNADEIIFALDIGTDARGGDARAEVEKSRLRESPDWDGLRARHVEAYRSKLGACKLELPFSAPDLPTDERVMRVRAGASDPDLLRLYFDFGRYLFASSVACGGYPPTLQGKWNEDIRPPWMCDFTCDINLQMAYWFCEPTGMADCFDAFMDLLEQNLPYARTVAKKLYGCRGALFCGQFDDSGRSTPESYGWSGFWVGGGAWLCDHVWKHYQYLPDRSFLQNRAYPLMKAVAEFYEDFLTRDADGVYQIMPSLSPENAYAGGGTKWAGSCCISSACDVQILYNHLQNCIAAARILGDTEKISGWNEILSHLPPFRVGADGHLLEWDRDYAETEPGHRHFSHLLGLFPFDLFTEAETPELYRAAALSFDRRMSHSGGHTGWSRVWSAVLCAALHRGDDAFEHLTRLLTDFASTTLLDLHPPKRFQIDGNFGAAGAVVTMLMRETRGVAELLPALPSAWPDGAMRGLRVTGGITVDLFWKDGHFAEADVKTCADGDFIFRIGAGSAHGAFDADGRQIELEKRAAGVWSLHLEKGKPYRIV